MRSAFFIYKYTKKLLAHKFPEFFKLKIWQIHMWDHEFSLFQNYNNAAEYGINNKHHIEEPAYFSLEFLTIMEMIPKEEFELIRLGIAKFNNKHGSGSSIFPDMGESTYFNMFESGEAFSVIGAIGIKKNSFLYPHVVQINFEVINISNSFCCLSMMLILNKEFKNDLSKFITSNVKHERNVSGYENKKWYQFKNLGNDDRPGSIIKNQLLNEILLDLSWKIAKEVHKFIPSMILTSHRVSLPLVSSFCTNIEANTFQEFWESIDIRPQFCDFTLDYNGCITWGRRSDIIFYVYGANKNNDFYSSNLATDIDKYLCNLLVTQSIDKDFRHILVTLSKKMSSIKNKNIREWMKLKLKIDTDIYYYMRFISEYHSNDLNYDNFVRIQQGKIVSPFINLLYNNLNSSVQDTQKLYSTIDNLFQSHLDFKNVKENYKIQKLSLSATIISVTVAILSLAVVEGTSEVVSSSLKYIWKFIWSLLENTL